MFTDYLLLVYDWNINTAVFSFCKYTVYHYIRPFFGGSGKKTKQKKTAIILDVIVRSAMTSTLLGSTKNACGSEGACLEFWFLVAVGLLVRQTWQPWELISRRETRFPFVRRWRCRQVVVHQRNKLTWEENDKQLKRKAGFSFQQPCFRKLLKREEKENGKTFRAEAVDECSPSLAFRWHFPMSAVTAEQKQTPL